MTLQNETTEILCQLLETGDEADRCYAARTLGVLRETSAVGILTQRLKDEDIDVCIDAAEALGNIGDPTAVAPLIESLQNDTSGEICRMVTASLGKLGSEEAIDALLEVSINRPEALEWDDDWDTWWDVQLEAIRALGRMGAEKAVEPISQLIDDEEQQDIENEILRALAAIPNKGVDTVIERLQNQDYRTQKRFRAARALTYADSPEALKALGRALKDPAPEVRAEAILALTAKNAHKYLSAIVLMLRDSSEEVRDASIKAITQLAAVHTDAEGLQESLFPMLTDPSGQVRTTLFNTLIPIVVSNPLSAENFTAIINSLSDPSAETATAACTLLGNNGNTEAIPALLALVADQAGHPMVRREAALSIGKLGQIDHVVVDTLTQAVGDKEQPVRLAALSALMTLENAGKLVTGDDQEETPRRPLDIVIEAVNGNIELVETDTEAANDEADAQSPADLREQALAAEEQPEQTQEESSQVVEFDPEGLNANSEAENAAEPESVPEEVNESIDLPETPGQIVQEGEVEKAMSTLEAITMDNVQAMLAQEQPQEEPEFDEATQEYLDVVEENKEIMRRIRTNKRVTPEQDVRRLGARVLSETDDEQAIDTLLQALNDHDQFVRREAAEAIGTIGQRNRKNPKLMDAVGTLITQLAITDVEQQVACAKTLSYLGNRAAIVPLIEALKDPQMTVRVQAIDSLARLATDSEDPEAAGHMVVRNVPPLSVARKILECLDDEESGVRVAAAKGLAVILGTLKEETFTKHVVEKIVSSVARWSGEEARLVGKILRGFDTTLANSLLIEKLQAAENSIQRSVFIEMIEELLHPDQDQPEQAA